MSQGFILGIISSHFREINIKILRGLLMSDLGFGISAASTSDIRHLKSDIGSPLSIFIKKHQNNRKSFPLLSSNTPTNRACVLQDCKIS
jgi:hypothetical protein